MLLLGLVTAASCEEDKISDKGAIIKTNILLEYSIHDSRFSIQSNMSEYVDDENRLECWGGLDTWEYK